VKTEFAIGTGRTEQGVAASGMLEAEDVAAATLLMATQPARSRITEIRMRPIAVQPLSMVDKSAFSPTGLTKPCDPIYPS
jgi:hypothetical protein